MSWFEKWVPGAWYRYNYVWAGTPGLYPIEAFRYGYEHEPPWYAKRLGETIDDREHGKLRIMNLGVWQYVNFGDWVCQMESRLFSVPHAVFIKLAEPA